MIIRNSTSGFTLIELMVSLFIGTLVVGSGLALFLQTNKVRDLTQAELTLQQSSYFVNQTIRQLTYQAGYRPLNRYSSTLPIFPVDIPEKSFVEIDNEWSQGQFIKAVENGFAFRFEGASDSSGEADGNLVNCSGDTFNENEFAEIELTVENGALVCTSSDVSIEIIGEDDDVTVENHALLWGIDNNADGSVDEYRDSSSPLLATDSLLAVRFTLLLSTLNEVQKNNLPYTFNGVEYASSDAKLRREFATTVHLKH